MKKNKMLSIAAAMVLTSTAAMAFETNTDGLIVTSQTAGATSKANYKPAANLDSTIEFANQFTAAYPATNPLALSANMLGDALIYPAFAQNEAEGWESDVVVTNTSTTEAVIGKVVIYAADDSRELVDFNIYLSANDVFRFKIKDGKITTSDDSVVKSAYLPNSTSTTRDIPTMNTLGDAMEINFMNQDDLEALNKGYVVIYGMAQADDDANASTDEAYHLNHDELFTDYRGLLDDCRAGWRTAFGADGMTNGMIRVAVPAPDVNDTCEATVGNGADTRQFKSVEQVLTGTVTIANTGADAREITLPAKALANFTDTANMLLWTEGEFAAIADRTIVVDSNATNTFVTAVDDVTRGYYVDANVYADNDAFQWNEAYYTFTTGSLNTETLANRFLITQPYKRTLVQLGNTQAYWTGINTTYPYGGFCSEVSAVYNDGEVVHNGAVSDMPGTITSPYNSNETPQCQMEYNELVALQDLQEGTDHEGTNGFARINFGTINGIVTQQIGTKVNGQAQTSWVYAPTVLAIP